MNWKLLTAAAAGVILGAGATQLYAQSKTPVYLVTEITLKDTAAYLKEYVPLAQANTKKYGINEVARGSAGGPGPQITEVQGEPPKRAVIQLFDSIEKMKEFRNSADYKSAKAIADKYAQFRSFTVESVSH
jgi:uncharacterized protein (DUF1330 family)